MPSFTFIKPECIPVGCVPPAHWPYFLVLCLPVAGGWSCPGGGVDISSPYQDLHPWPGPPPPPLTRTSTPHPHPGPDHLPPVTMWPIPWYIWCQYVQMPLCFFSFCEETSNIKFWWFLSVNEGRCPKISTHARPETRCFHSFLIS